MRYCAIILAVAWSFLAPLAHAYTSPGTPQGSVSDFANLLSSQAQQNLEQQLVTFAKEKNHEIAVVTIQSLGSDAIEDYANTLFREWGIGKKEYNNGVLFLIAADDRKMRIEVGYGLEGALTDLESKHIQDDIVRPLFRQGNYEEGIQKGAEGIMQAIEGEVLPSPSSRKTSSWFGIIQRYGGEVLFILIFFLSWIASILGRTKSWWLGGVIGGVAGGITALLTSAWLWLPAVVVFGLLFDYAVSKNFQSHHGNHPAWWAGGTWGGWDRWGGGGGFGGFGGGSSGGGGSSSSW
ncbi:MAG: TPM domain-containing protein [Patescibacteria group bacterium]